MKDKKVVVIGSGIGGSGIAALLAKEGAKPIVIERNDFIGGKAGSYEFMGCKIEHGIHISARGERDPLAELAGKVGADVHYINKSPVMRLVYGSHEGVIHQNMLHPASLYNMCRIIKPSLKSTMGILRFGLLVNSIKTMDDAKLYFEVPAKSIIDKYMTDPDMYSFLDFCCGIMFCIPAAEASAGGFLLALNHWMIGGRTAYPKGGYGAIPQAYIKVCEQGGGQMRLNEMAKRIVVINGEVKGVETDQDYFPADIVVSNAGVVNTVALAGRQYFPGDYVGRADKSVDSFAGCTVQYVLNAPLARTPGTLYIPKEFNLPKQLKDLGQGKIPEDTSLFIISPTAADPTLAPEGKHLLFACASAPASMLDRDLNNKVFDLIEARMAKLFPGLEKHTISKHRHGVDYVAAIGGRGRGEAIGMAQRHDQDGDKRFSPRTPVKGLYIVGADTGSFGIGTELAAQSAMETHGLIMDDFAVK